MAVLCREFEISRKTDCKLYRLPACPLRPQPGPATASRFPITRSMTWLVSFMHYDLGFFDNETCRVECAGNQSGARVLPMPAE